MARLQTATVTGVGSTRWIKLNPHVTPFQASVQVGLGGGTGTFQVEITLDEPDATVGGPGWVAPVSLLAPGTAPVSADEVVTLNLPVTAVRVTATAGTAVVLVRVLQAGLE